MFRRIFFIRREERWPAAILTAFYAVMWSLVLNRWWELFTCVPDDPRKAAIRGYHFSGFDPLTLAVLTDWFPHYNEHRHPLLAFFLYPFSLLNDGLMSLMGMNCGAFIIMALLLVSVAYSFVFMYRILREVVGVNRLGSLILSYFLFSIGYVMTSQLAPDHFAYSLTMLLLTLYVAGIKMKEGVAMKTWETVVLFFITAGITLNNGLKTFLASLFVNGRRFFRPLHLLLAVIVPAGLIWLFADWEYKTWVWPKEMERHEQRKIEQKRKAEEKERQKKLREIEAQQIAAQKSADANAGNAAGSRDSLAKDSLKKVKIKHYKNFSNANRGKPITNTGYLRWTDIKTDRWESLHSNLFGESIQLHQQYLLKDGLYSRPLFVDYDYIHNYVVEGIVVLLFLIGIWFGRRSRFFWLCMSFFALDLLLHVGLGFGLNEVYIMTDHWIYVIPVAMAFTAAALRGRLQAGYYALVGVLTVYLYVHNASLIVSYL